MKNISIIPRPAEIKVRPDYLDLRDIMGIMIAENSKELKNTADIFKSFLSPISNLKISPWNKSSGKYIKIIIEKKTSSKGGDYSLIIDDTGITLKASEEQGLYYGFQTFRQLAPVELEKNHTGNTKIRNCSIKDSPKFQYRGMHLDVSRHFFDIDFIKTYIDMIALHKMNFFHWHLTDDNGWRIEIEKYPDLSKNLHIELTEKTSLGEIGIPYFQKKNLLTGGFIQKKKLKK